MASFNSSLKTPRVDAPRNSKTLAALAEDFTFTDLVPLKYWTRTAEAIFKEAQINIQENDLEQAYLLYYRYSVLVLNNLRKHPDAKTAEGKRTIRKLAERVTLVLRDLEHLKPLIDDAHERSGHGDDLGSQQDGLTQGGSPKRAADEPAARSRGHVKDATVLNAGQHQDLAVDLAQQEIRRRDAAKKASRKAGFWEGWEKEHSLRQPQDVRPKDEEEDMRAQMEMVRRRLDERSAYEVGDTSPVQAQTYSYPKIFQSVPLAYSSEKTHLRQEFDYGAPPSPPPKYPSTSRDLPARPLHPANDPTFPPARPLRETFYDSGDDDEYKPPPGPPPKLLLSQRGPEVPLKRALDSPRLDGPAPKREKRVTFAAQAFLEDGTPLRPVFLPSSLRHEFVKIAAPKTRQGIEMCGLLCGTVVNNALFINTLLIPQQRGTSDTCETTNEESIWDFISTADKIVIGWIHTHPTQTCFMSSRDVHTHASYQTTMEESIAIVCSPRHDPDYGIFRLTKPPGLSHILGCRDPAMFHQHSIDDIYTSARWKPGHVCETSKLEFEVHDLRES